METSRTEREQINELETTVSQLRESVEKKNKELEKYQHLSVKYRRLKKKNAGYARDRVVLLVFSLILIGILCYQGIKMNNAKVEQEKLQEMYKNKNGTGPNQDVYLDPL